MRLRGTALWEMFELNGVPASVWAVGPQRHLVVKDITGQSNQQPQRYKTQSNKSLCHTFLSNIGLSPLTTVLKSTIIESPQVLYYSQRHLDSTGCLFCSNPLSCLVCNVASALHCGLLSKPNGIFVRLECILSISYRIHWRNATRSSCCSYKSRETFINPKSQ